jgi:hypothetical protein
MKTYLSQFLLKSQAFLAWIMQTSQPKRTIAWMALAYLLGAIFGMPW